MANILSISYNATLLITRQMLLEQMGHTVDSAEGFSKAYKFCEGHKPHYDLIVLGHSIPHDDKVVLVEQCTKACNCPILALLRHTEAAVPGAARSIDSSDPRAFIAAVNDVLKDRKKSRRS